MGEEARSISWLAPEHRHIEKTNDWYWAVGIIAIAASVASILFDNILFGVVIMLAAASMILFGHRAPRALEYEVSLRGIRVSKTLYPYDSLELYSINEHDANEPELLVRSKHLLMPFIIIPIPPEYIDDIDLLLSQRIPEGHITEPLSNRVLEFFGF